MIIINPRLLSCGVTQTWGTLHSICTHKHDSKQKYFNLQPLQTSQILAQHLQVSVVRIHPTPPHTVTSRKTLHMKFSTVRNYDYI